jgi:hypothetical protein
MKFTQSDVWDVLDHSRKYWLDKAVGGRLPGAASDIDAREHIALSYINAVLIKLHQKGLLDDSLLDLIQIEREDGELATEGFDSAASNS